MPTDNSKIKVKGKLPNKLWKLVDMAIKDLKWSITKGKAEINMGVWVESERQESYEPGAPSEPCGVCLAGGVMLRRSVKSSLRGMLEHAGTVDWTDFESPWDKAFLALEKVRGGEPMEAVNLFYSNEGVVRKQPKAAILDKIKAISGEWGIIGSGQFDHDAEGFKELKLRRDFFKKLNV